MAGIPTRPYQRLNQPWPSDRISGQTMWMLNDFSAENGGTGLVPYSHRKGHRPAPETASEWNPDAEVLTGTRGSVMVMHGATWHTARPNTSNAPRSALLGMYIRPIYVTQEDMRAQLADLDNPSELVRQFAGRQPAPAGASWARTSNAGGNARELPRSRGAPQSHPAHHRLLSSRMH